MERKFTLYDEYSYLCTSDRSEMLPWIDRSTRLIAHNKIQSRVSIFSQPHWRRAAVPLCFYSLCTMLPEKYHGPEKYSGRDVFYRDWLGDILAAAVGDRQEDICMLGGHTLWGDFAKMCLIRPEADRIIGVYHEDPNSFYYLEDSLIFDETESWVISPYLDDTFLFAGEPEIMQRFYDRLGGEKYMEYCFAQGMNDQRIQYSGAGICSWYAQTDWELPFTLVEGEGYLNRADWPSEKARTEQMLFERFSIPPSQRCSLWG
ncbi:MAG: hypothetical protein RIC36_05105 [Rhodospirillales bacterium]